jgi:hypothetical protein
MKYLKKYKLFESNTEIDSICQQYGIQNYTINEDGSIDVDGNVYLSYEKLYELPLKFGRVTGNFDCSRNQLTTLEGCPGEVGGGFYCNGNKLTTLEGCPREVGGYFNCSYNKLTTLDGCPKMVDGEFNCGANNLTIINDELEFVKIIGYFDIEYNPIYQVYKLFSDFESFKYSLDYNYFREPNLIVKHRFEEACGEAGIKTPEKIIGYQYI